MTFTIEHAKARLKVMEDAVTDVQGLANALYNDLQEKKKAISAAHKSGDPEQYAATLYSFTDDAAMREWIIAFHQGLIACRDTCGAAGLAADAEHTPRIIAPKGVH